MHLDLPPGFDKRVGSKVCKLKKPLYDLKKSPRAWFERLTHYMKKISFCQRQTDHTLFLKYSPKDKSYNFNTLCGLHYSNWR